MIIVWIVLRHFNVFSTRKGASVRLSLLCNTLEFPLFKCGCLWAWLLCIKRAKKSWLIIQNVFILWIDFGDFPLNRDNILEGLHTLCWFRWYFGDIHVSDILVCKLFSFRLSQLRIDRMARVKQIRSNFHDIADDDDDDGFFPLFLSWWQLWWGGLFVVKVMSR